MTERYTLLHDQQEVEKSIRRVASEIIAWADLNNVNDPLFVALMNSGLPFATKLMPAIIEESPDSHPTLRVITVARNEFDEPEVTQELPRGTDIRNRDTVLIEGCLDRGRGVEAARQYLCDLGARTVMLATLIEKFNSYRSPTVQPDFVAFKTDDIWIAGSGARDRAVHEEAHRWSPHILTIRRDDLPPHLSQPTSPLIST